MPLSDVTHLESQAFFDFGTGAAGGSYCPQSWSRHRACWGASSRRDDDGVLAMLGLGDIGDRKNMLSIDGMTSSIAGAAMNAVGNVVSGAIGSVADKFK